ncbi:hypothetical protein [Chryseobacterium sp. ISL-6]|uniref:hypothetical protein n=1 Tax=Chryseobacterium sp. ISL-6 TaxID=2819143 RepID=UPI001BEA4BF3|nr:hypothetical protein [Chryseobacterium sp. ISL-6]MBT2622740.1 hypothetical protein [Chryseobacterium sp. ISL-6]
MNYYYAIIVVVLCILLTFSCTDKKDKSLRDFNDYSFDTLLSGEGLYNIGYEFNIDGKYYVDKKYNFIYQTQDLNNKNILIPNTFSNNQFPIYWRETNLPFRIIKKANSDTLIIIKDNKKFIFKRKKNVN